jgi:hypothetical protein
MAGKTGPTYWQSLKLVLAPLGVMFGIATAVFHFAAGAWVRGIVVEELAAAELTVVEHSHTLVEHAHTLEMHTDDIQDNEDDIDKFSEFVKEVIEKL